MSRTISVSELQTELNRKTVLLLDVRREADYQADAQRLPGAERRDPAEIDAWIASLPQDRAVVLYCMRGGSVSNGVLDRLLAQGVPARYLEGGLEAWKQAQSAPVR